MILTQCVSWRSETSHFSHSLPNVQSLTKSPVKLALSFTDFRVVAVAAIVGSSGLARRLSSLH